MRNIFIFVLAIAFLSTVTTQGLCVNGAITSQEEVQHVHIKTNRFGVATKSTTTTTSTVVTQNADGSKTTSTSVTVVTADWRAGSLKTSSIVSNSTEKNDQTGVVLNSSNYTDTYKYNEVTGILESVSGTGNTMTFDEESGQRNIGTLTRSFTVRDGQALLLSSRNEGVVNDKNGARIGTFHNTTSIDESDYEYRGGSWVPMKQPSVQTNYVNDGSSTVVAKTTQYQRDANGTITEMIQTATGTRIVVTGKDTAQEFTKTYTLQNYNANITFDAQEGWYSAGEDYDWVLSSSTTPRAANDIQTYYPNYTVMQTPDMPYYEQYNPDAGMWEKIYYFRDDWGGTWEVAREWDPQNHAPAPNYDNRVQFLTPQTYTGP